MTGDVMMWLTVGAFAAISAFVYFNDRRPPRPPKTA